MKFYRCKFDEHTVIEGEETDDYWAASLADARRVAREWLAQNNDDDGRRDYVDVELVDVVTAGRGWLRAVLNGRGYVHDRTPIERWCWVDDGAGGRPRIASTGIPEKKEKSP